MPPVSRRVWCQQGLGIFYFENKQGKVSCLQSNGLKESARELHYKPGICFIFFPFPKDCTPAKERYSALLKTEQRFFNFNCLVFHFIQALGTISTSTKSDPRRTGKALAQKISAFTLFLKEKAPKLPSSCWSNHGTAHDGSGGCRTRLKLLWFL